MRSRKLLWVLTGIFLVAEAVLFALILLGCDKGYYYTAIVLCFLYSLLHIHHGDRYIVAALGFTLVADYFLVLGTDRDRIWGMAFFLVVQILYAVRLQRIRPSRPFLILRLVLILAAEAITVAVLHENTDPLAVISLCYYANLLVNIVEGFAQFPVNRLYPIGMVLFLLCDTFIGLQTASGEYLPIRAESMLYQILFPGFDIAWLFYLPSQVLLSISSTYNRSIHKEES